MKILTKHYFLFALAFAIVVPNLSWARDNKTPHSRYDSKDRKERQKFDRNFHRYQNLSPEEREHRRKKWRKFKSRTTPEEREYIRRKIQREKRQRSHQD